MSKPYKSQLASLLEQYLEYRASIGFISNSQRGLLRPFDEHMACRKVELRELTPAFFLEFKRPLTGSSKTRNQKISAVRGFFEFLVRRQIVYRNPLSDIPSDRENAYMQFIFSSGQTLKLLKICEVGIRHEKASFFRDLTVYTATLLLAHCGLRLSEPTRLKLDDYDRREGSIYIEKTKFSKDRLIPVPKKCLSHLDNYLNMRLTFEGDWKYRFLLPGRGESKLSQKEIYRNFHKAVIALGVYQPPRVNANMSFGAPTPHSLRHSFAINTLKNIKKRGGSPQDALPVLSAYLGHRKIRYTAVYLKYLDAESRGYLVDFEIKRQEEI